MPVDLGVKKMEDTLDQLIDLQLQAHSLPASYRQQIDDFISPFAQTLITKTQSLSQPLVVGINGGQGSGKSTLCHFLALVLRERYQLATVVLSIDNFYWGKQHRQQLAQDIHPLLQTRGVPGTHNVPLALATFAKLLAGQATQLPQFDKAQDDVVAKTDWPLQQSPVAIILFEGWCVGSRPQDNAVLDTAINSLERDEDTDGQWRHYVNQQLAGPYQQWFAHIDYLLMLKVPNMEAVQQWRKLQEKKLVAKAAGGDGLMNETQIDRFIAHYERLTRHNLAEIPTRADQVFQLSMDHQFIAATGLTR
ncbi:MAG: D-glycerate 3-kinase [Oceanicoccus sp.]|jgi:D-glycerate 3-kinase